MNDDERELLKELCGWVGGISSALADGAGLYDLAQVHRSGVDKIGPLFERVFPPNSGGVSIRCQTLPGGSVKIG